MRGLRLASAMALVATAALVDASHAQAPDSNGQAPSVNGSDLRPSDGGDLPAELRRAPSPTDTFSPRDSQSPYEPFSRGSEDATDRPDDFEPPTAEDETALPTDIEPKFDLFDGPDGRPATPGNLAATPAAAGGAENLPATTTTRDAAARNGDLRGQGNQASQGGASRNGAGRNGTNANRNGRTVPADPLLAARNGGLPARDLAVPTVARRTLAVDTLTGRQNLAVTALRGTIPIAVDDPFAPVGIRVGTFVLYSTLEQSIGASTNLSNSGDGKGGLFSETALSERLLSDWSQHQFEMNALASYRRNFAGEIESEPRVAIDGKLRLDVDSLTTATLRGAFEYRQEDPIDLNATDSLTDRPDILTYSTGAEIQRQVGRATVSLDGSAIRQDKSKPTETANLAVLDESYTTYTAKLRTGYDISPALRPFVEGSLGLRTFDDEKDLSGIERNSTIQSLRTGVEFDLGEKFLGEVAAGYAWNVPDADEIATTGSPTIDARLAWSPQRGTDVVFTAATNFDPDTDGSGTSTLYEGAVALRHRLTDRTDLNGTISLAYRDSDIATEVETSYAAEAGFTYWLNRSLAFTGLVRHEGLESKQPGSDYTADTAKIGLRLQR